ncbi:MAG TPA: hypothetical protein VFX30_02330 [bacterium]|nr:hypothetical protein [bacterium]
MKRFPMAIMSGLAALAISSTAGAEKKDAKTNSAFEQIKALSGTWTGKGEMEGKEQTMTTKFRVTSAGTAVEEVMFPGTGHEMVNMYYPDGDGVSMVHYCAMGNQPRLKLTSKGGKKLDFTYVDGSNIPSPDSPHMSDVSLTIKGKDKLTEDWKSTGGESKKPTTFVFTRVE